MKLFKKVDNDNNLKNIIDKIEFNYKESENQDNLFTSEEIEEVQKELEERGF